MARVFAWCKAQKGLVRASAAALAFNISRDAASTTLRKLVRRGALGQEGPKNRHYRVANPDADVSSHIGCHPKSTNNLKVNHKPPSRKAIPRLKDGRYVPIATRKYPPSWPRMTELERCWPQTSDSMHSGVDAQG
jgi:hypothetical protein